MNRKLLWLILAVVCAVAVIICLVLLLRPAAELPPAPAPSTPSPSFSEPPVSVSPDPSPEPSEPDELEIPVDFEALQAENPDIYAWISFPEAGIDYPILQRFGNDDYYLRRDVNGNSSSAGSLYTEYRYNVTDFSDPVTIIYGHNMNNGSMFGTLQLWFQQAELGEDTTFTIYQPGRRLTYRLFAGVPHDSSHVLYYNNFHKEEDYTAFFDKTYASRDFQAVLDPEGAPSYENEDRVVILSTCLRGNRTNRFLAMGVLIEDIEDTEVAS